MSRAAAGDGQILLVEDNAEMRRLLKSMVEKIANEIIEASDGAAAVELYRTERPDWVLMDIFMKPTDGLAAAGAIKGMDAKARIIFVSNHGPDLALGTSWCTPEARSDPLAGLAVSFR